MIAVWRHVLAETDVVDEIDIALGKCNCWVYELDYSTCQVVFKHALLRRDGILSCIHG